MCILSFTVGQKFICDSVNKIPKDGSQMADIWACSGKNKACIHVNMGAWVLARRLHIINVLRNQHIPEIPNFDKTCSDIKEVCKKTYFRENLSKSTKLEIVTHKQKISPISV